MDAALNNARPAPEAGTQRTQRYWAPCLAVALAAMFLFYVALTDLVKERAARTPALQAVAMPAVVQPPLVAANDDIERPARMQARPMARVVASEQMAEATPVVAKPVRFEVTKCVTSSGEAEYSDGPCSDGARATTLRLQ